MSPQTYIIAIVYTLILIISTGTTWKQNGFSMSLLLGFILSLAFVVLLAYDTLCLTQGNCGVWSWIRTVIYIIIPVIAMITWIVMLFKKDDPNTNNVISQPLVSVPVPTVSAEVRT
jgi:uncharacterized membrane protein YesL